MSYNEANVETAMCLWEALLEIRDRPDVDAMFQRLGTVEMRHAVISLVEDCERDWEESEHEDLPYDWEHCPNFLERNLDRIEVYYERF